jgi:hypothetical protein
LTFGKRVTQEKERVPVGPDIGILNQPKVVGLKGIIVFDFEVVVIGEKCSDVPDCIVWAISEYVAMILEYRIGAIEKDDSVDPLGEIFGVAHRRKKQSAKQLNHEHAKQDGWKN